MEGEKNTIHTYHQDYQINSPDQLPLPSSHRTCTDLFCSILSILLALAMFVIALSMLNLKNLRSITYPTDGDGKKCTLDHSSYNYLYFTSFTDPTKRLCVSECPKGNEERLNCWPTENLSCGKNTNPGFEVQIYSSVPSETSLGLFCLPKDDALRKKILQNSNLYEKFTFIKALHAVWISAGFTFLLGIIYLILIACIPNCMVYSLISGGGLSCIAVGILLMVQNSRFLHNQGGIIIAFSVVMILFGIFCLYSLYNYRNDIRLCISYIERGMKILSMEKGLIALIPVFILLLLGLVCLFGFQTFGIWSNSKIQFHQEEIYYEPTGTFASVATFWNAVQLIWGLCFLKEAFNFIVSGSTITFYYSQKVSYLFGISNLFRFHWGSVVAGSFLLNFFYLFDVLYDAIKPADQNSGCYRFFHSVCCCCDRILGFARGEAHAFINLVGLPYCNSARWCERLSYLTDYFNGSQSIFRFFRVGAHVLISLIGMVFSFYYTLEAGDANAPLLLCSFIINIFTITFFICLVTDLAETLLLCELVEKYLNNEQMGENEKYMMEKESQFDEGYDVYPTSRN